VIGKDYTILQVSENVKKGFGVEANSLLNKRIDDIPIIYILSDMLAFLKGERQEKSISVNINEQAGYEVSIHEEELYFILEYIFIPQEETSLDFQKLFRQIFGLPHKLSSLKTFSQVCQTFAEAMKEVLGFDKVLIYQFLEDEHGEVVAEAKEGDMESYLGLHFPKTDIPIQVRLLYLKNPLRYIHDSYEDPIPLIPSINPLTQKPLNLSFCILKGVIPVHRKYINNMHIRTSASYAVTVEGKLWGLISCHNKLPKILSRNCLLVLEHFARLFSNQCLLNDNTQQLIIEEQLGIISQVIERLTTNQKNIHEAFLEKKNEVLRLVNAAGAALYFDGQWTLIGSTPQTQEIEYLIKWFGKNLKKDIFHTESLSRIVPEALAYENVSSGIIAASLGYGTPNYIMWFRPEQRSTVKWGGNPSDAIGISNSSAGVNPRSSFSLWTEESSGCSKKWLPQELNVVEVFIKGMVQSFLSTFYLKKMIAEADLLKIQLAADKASEGILVLDKMGEVEWMNSRLIHLLGKNSLEEVLLPLVSLLDTLSRTILNSLNTAIQNKEKISLEINLKDRCLLFTLSPFDSFVSNEIKLIGIATDITKINQISKELETKADALELANKHLNELNKEKDKFIRMAAHDLRNPLSSITMASLIIENMSIRDEGSNFQQMLTIIKKQSTAMLDLLNDILNDNVIQSGQFTINKQSVDVKKFINEICELHQLVASKNKIKIKIEEHLAQPTFEMDKIKIKQVIDNFLSNAIKFSPPKSVVKLVCTTSLNSLKVELQDQGPGISEKNRDKIFEQGTKIISKPTGNETHGLGLSICKQIVRAHKGEIGVNTTDKGTVFYFELKV